MKTKIRKKQFPYKLYRTTVVLLFHPEKEIKELFEYAVHLDSALKEYIEPGYDWSKIGAMVLEPTADNKIYLLVGRHTEIHELVHECSHITNYMFGIIDTSHNPETDESYSYLLDNVFEDVYNYITKIMNEAQLLLFLQLPKPNNQAG
jgi:hypothetical protein